MKGGVDKSPLLGDRDSWDLVFPLLTTENQNWENKAAIFCFCSSGYSFQSKLLEAQGGQAAVGNESYRTLSLVVTVGQSLTGFPLHLQHEVDAWVLLRVCSCDLSAPLSLWKV